MTPVVSLATGLGVAAVVEDLRRRRVPNWLTAAGATVGLAFATVFGGLSAAHTPLSNPRTRAMGYAPAIGLGAWISPLGGGW